MFMPSLNYLKKGKKKRFWGQGNAYLYGKYSTHSAGQELWFMWPDLTSVSLD